MPRTAFVATLIVIEVAIACPACTTGYTGSVATQSAIEHIQTEHKGTRLVAQSLLPVDLRGAPQNALVDGYVLDAERDETLIYQETASPVLRIPTASIQKVTAEDRIHPAVLAGFVAFAVAFSVGAVRGQAAYSRCPVKGCWFDFGGPTTDMIGGGLFLAVPASVLAVPLGWIVGSKHQYIFNAPGPSPDARRSHILNQPVRRPFGPGTPVF